MLVLVLLVVAARFVVLFLEGGEHAPCLLHVRPDGLADAFGLSAVELLAADSTSRDKS